VSDDELEKPEVETPTEPDAVVGPPAEESAPGVVPPVDDVESPTEPSEDVPEAVEPPPDAEAPAEPDEPPARPPIAPVEPAPLPPPEPSPALAPTPPPLKPGPGRLRRLVVLVLAVALFAPPVSVVVFRIIPPPITELMVQRLIQGYGLDYQWRPLSQISPDLTEAAVASEDARYCSHHGFDFAAMQAAMRHNERRPNGKVKGGSTISQQTAKNVFLWPGRSYIRKGAEAWYTVLIETLWGKRRIMEVYLNVVEFGPGVYGAQAASQHFFHEDASHLSAAQAAHLIAVLPKPLSWRVAAPGAYVARRSRRIDGAIGTVRDDGLAGCVGR
jgi:monofunctional glycosyltransferase